MDIKTNKFRETSMAYMLPCGTLFQNEHQHRTPYGFLKSEKMQPQKLPMDISEKIETKVMH